MKTLNRKQEEQEQERSPQTPSKHISFSELKKWSGCPYARELAYGQRIRLFTGNTYTAFGTALHETIEEIYSKSPPLESTTLQAKDLFLRNLNKCIADLEEESLDEALLREMPNQGIRIIEGFTDSLLNDYFGDFEVVSLEEEIYEPIYEENGYNFKGFIDMVIKTGEIYHVIDWKSCTWGWNAKKRSDPMNVYQLTLYKKFFAQKHKIDPQNIKTYFGLLKRTPLKNNIEIFEVTNGKKRTENAVQLLLRALKNIKSGLNIKNRLSCKYCEFYETEHCS